MEDNKTLVKYSFLSLLSLGAVLSFVYLFQNYHSSSTRAQENSLTLKIKLQGESYPQATMKTTVAFYGAQGKVKEYKDVVFTYQPDNTFKGTVVFDSSFDYNILYALFVKPNKYFGRLFCSDTIDGKSCASPQFTFKQSMYIADFSKKMFSGGDIDPANGKVDAYDISKIMSNLGKSSDLSTDINNDGITNSIDYLLALYSLGSNMSDDVIALGAPSPTLTATPSATITPTGVTGTPTPMTTPTITTTPTPTPAVTNTPTPTSTAPTPTLAVTNTPTPTVAPTATTVPTVGTCHVVDPWGASSDLKVGASQCSCVMGVCAQATCSTCNSASPCVCNPNSMPSEAGSTLPCTNGGGLFIKKVSGC